MNHQPDIDICSACGEHTEFYCCEEGSKNLECDCDGIVLSNCCGAGSYDTDPDIDMER
jgi:hypothetical protein